MGLVLIMSGCAGTLTALKESPQRAEEFVKDPVRTRNMMGRIIEGLAGAAATAGCWFFLGPFGLLCGPVGEYLVYEYGLEPAGLGGPYWERGPRAPVVGVGGTIAEPGDVFREFTEPECRFYQATWHPDPQLPSGGWCESGNVSEHGAR